jgi:hypothetical protein
MKKVSYQYLFLKDFGNPTMHWIPIRIQNTRYLPGGGVRTMSLCVPSDVSNMSRAPGEVVLGA